MASLTRFGRWASGAHVRRARLLAILMGVLLFWPFTVLVLLHGVSLHIADVTPYLGVLALPAAATLVVSRFLFSRLGVYLALTAVGLALGAFGLLRPRERPVSWVLTLCVVASIVALPWTHRYWPAVRGAPGQEVRLVTAAGPLWGVTRTFQAIGELRPAEYRLLGWQEGALYYQEMRDAVWRTWRYAPEEGAPAPVLEPPGPLEGERLARLDVAERVADASPAVLGEVSYASPDGEWLAVVSEHLYGPQDVLLVRVE